MVSPISVIIGLFIADTLAFTIYLPRAYRILYSTWKPGTGTPPPKLPLWRFLPCCGGFGLIIWVERRR